MLNKIAIQKEITKLAREPWQPIEITKVNESVVRLAKFQGEYHWHMHKDADELFYVYQGSIKIEIKNQEDVNLKTGELVVIPKGVEHRPVCKEEAYVLLFEPQELKSSGD